MSRTERVPIPKRTGPAGWYSSRRPGPGGMSWKCKTSTHRAERQETRRRERAEVEARPAVTCRGCRGGGCADCDYTGEPSLEDLLHYRGRRLYEARRASGLSVTQFCEVSGLTRTQIFAAEAGEFDAAEALGRLAQGR